MPEPHAERRMTARNAGTGLTIHPDAMRTHFVRIVALIVALAGACLTRTAAAQTAGDDLVGLWSGDGASGPAVRGILTLERGGALWTMRIGAFAASTRVTGDSIRVALPGNRGELRAHLEAVGQAVRGFWIQPAGNSPAYATPVILEPVGGHAWRGTVTPLDERFSLYLMIQRSGDGSLKGVFRNPEFGWNGGARSYRITRDGDQLKFTDPRSGRVRLTQTYDSAQRVIRFDFGQPLPLTPRATTNAVGFYPRTPAIASYAYAAPLPAHDGWSTARAADVGLVEAQLVALVQRIVATDPASDTAALVHSVLVARHGKLVLEEYFYGFTAERPHDLRSGAKTFASVLAGVAMDHGAPLSMETSLYSMFPTESDTRADPRKLRITVGHTLTHSTGLACDDNDDNSPGNEDKLQSQPGQRDWYRYMLDLAMVHDPGTVYAYCSGTMNLAGGAIARATGTWLPDYFDRYVARPLQIDHYAMNLMPTEQWYAGGGVYMRPRDLLKFGSLYLNGGLWNGTRVVSKAWVERSTAQQMTTPTGGSDGYAWHRNVLHANGRDYQEYEANGNGGQFLIVVPELDLAVVFTAGNYQQYGVWRKFRDEWVPRYVIEGAK